MLRLLAVAPIALSLAFTATGQSVQQRLDELTSTYADTALVVMVTTPDETFVATGGSVDVNEDSLFRIASMSKTYVAVTALRMAEEGALALDDPVAPHLPVEVRERVANAETVTLRQLLAMRSDIPDYLATDGFWEAVEADPQRSAPWTPAEALRFIYDEPAEFRPDAGFAYSNSSYLLAQMAMEAISGQPLHALVRDYLLDPLGLRSTFTHRWEALPDSLVDSFYDFDGDGTPENVSALDDGAGMGDGALVASAADVSAFYVALLRDQTVLTRDSMAQLLDFQQEQDDIAYSLGLIEAALPDGQTAWGHNGGVVGFLSAGWYLPESSAVIVILSSGEPIDIEALAVDVVAVVGE